MPEKLAMSGVINTVMVRVRSAVGRREIALFVTKSARFWICSDV
jgi:hypothetical protein